jgi:hypothetical protein
MQIRNFGILWALVVLLHAVPASAQDRPPQTREGLGISFSIGAGSAEAICTLCTFGRETGASGYLRIGGYIGPKFFLAGESHGWFNSESNLDELLGFYTVTAQWYPSESMGLYLKSGLGIGLYVAEGYGYEYTGSAPAVVLGLGHDFRVGRNFSLTPYLNYLRSSDLNPEVNGTPIGLNVSSDLIQIGLGFTWH